MICGGERKKKKKRADIWSSRAGTKNRGEEIRWLQCFLHRNDQNIVVRWAVCYPLMTARLKKTWNKTGPPKNESAHTLTKKKREEEVGKSNNVMKGSVLIRLRRRNLCWQANVRLSGPTLTFRSDFPNTVDSTRCAYSYT